MLFLSVEKREASKYMDFLYYNNKCNCFLILWGTVVMLSVTDVSVIERNVGTYQVSCCDSGPLKYRLEKVRPSTSQVKTGALPGPPTAGCC